jgi:glutamyl-tRNA reductase
MRIAAGCVLKVGVVGLNHKTAELSFRESMAKGASALAGEKALFFPHPTVLLSTCNRTEIYFSAENLAEAHSDLLLLLRRHIAGPFEHRLYSYFGIDCFAHLGRVASGLDSAILAETEIQRQVKVAYEFASEYASLPPCLHFIFQKALKIGKTIRSQPLFERGAPSLSNTIWELISHSMPNWSQKKALFVGYSKMNRTLAAYLIRKGMRDLTFATRDPSSVRLSHCTGFDRSILKSWQNFDLLFCASQSNESLITGTSRRSPLIFDLSVPRNVDPALAGDPQITLYNIEQLNQIIDQKQKAQSKDYELCEELVWENVLKLARIYRENRLMPILSSATR